MTTIRLRPNGPLVIEDTGDLEIVDAHGVACEIVRRPVALCRCGASATKPFCDGSHRRVGFSDGSSSDGSNG